MKFKHLAAFQFMPWTLLRLHLVGSTLQAWQWRIFLILQFWAACWSLGFISPIWLHFCAVITDHLLQGTNGWCPDACWGFWCTGWNEHEQCLIHVVVRWDWLEIFFFSWKFILGTPKGQVPCKNVWLTGGVCALLQGSWNELCLPAWQEEIIFALFTFSTSSDDWMDLGKRKMLDWFSHPSTKSTSVGKV